MRRGGGLRRRSPSPSAETARVMRSAGMRRPRPFAAGVSPARRTSRPHKCCGRVAGFSTSLSRRVHSALAMVNSGPGATSASLTARFAHIKSLEDYFFLDIYCLSTSEPTRSSCSWIKSDIDYIYRVIHAWLLCAYMSKIRLSLIIERDSHRNNQTFIVPNVKFPRLNYLLCFDAHLESKALQS